MGLGPTLYNKIIILIIGKALFNSHSYKLSQIGLYPLTPLLYIKMLF